MIRWSLSGALMVLAGLCLAAALSGCGINEVPRLDEQVRISWSEVLNQYQRRSDLIPNLVETAKAYAAQEQDTLKSLVDARAKAMRTQIPADILNNPEAFHQFEQNQAVLGAALERLQAISENYPDLTSNSNFTALQSQLKGTENRIAIARRDYMRAVRAYNTQLLMIPGRWIASVLYPDAKAKETFTISKAEF